MKTVILDTNALMAIGQFKIDIFSEIDRKVDFKYEINVLDKTFKELEGIERGQKGKQEKAAKLAREIIEKKEIKKIKTGEGKVDELLVEEAKKGAIIITQDKELKERIKEAKGKVMTIRQGKKVVFV